MSKIVKQWLCVIILSCLSITAYARAIMIISPATSGSANLSQAGAALLNYTVTNNTNSLRLRNFTIYPAFGAGSNVQSAMSLKNNTCNGLLEPGGSCSFQIQLQGNTRLPAGFNVSPRVCAYSIGSSSAICSEPAANNRVRVNVMPALAYLSKIGSLTSCPLNLDGSLGTCSNVTNTGVTFTRPAAITFNARNTLAYVAERNTSPNGFVGICNINSDGSFGNCIGSGNAGVSFSNPAGIALNSTETFAYVTNRALNAGGNGVSVCPINADGTFGACFYSGNIGGVSLVASTGIVLNNTDTLAYVTNSNDSRVLVCPIKADGTFDPCQNSGQVFGAPHTIALNNAGTVAYVTDGTNNTVSLCPIKANGLFDTCTNVGNGFNVPYGIALNSTGTVAYIANNDSSVTKCPINSDGTFATCTSSGGGAAVTWYYITLG